MLQNFFDGTAPSDGTGISVFIQVRVRGKKTKKTKIAIVMTLVVRPYDVMRSNFGVCCVWRGLAEALACG